MDILVLDSFTSQPFKGNPAAVCVLKNETIDANKMQQIATEMRHSETAFVWQIFDSSIKDSQNDLSQSESNTQTYMSSSQSDNKFGIRWFTPTNEVDLCGHATLAAAAALFKKGMISSDSVTFHAIMKDVQLKVSRVIKSVNKPLASGDNSGQLQVDQILDQEKGSFDSKSSESDSYIMSFPCYFPVLAVQDSAVYNIGVKLWGRVIDHNKSLTENQQSPVKKKSEHPDLYHLHHLDEVYYSVQTKKIFLRLKLDHSSDQNLNVTCGTNIDQNTYLSSLKIDDKVFESWQNLVQQVESELESKSKSQQSTSKTSTVTITESDSHSESWPTNFLIRGVCITLSGTMSNHNDYSDTFLSRYFSPWNGIGEDPVNGSSHTVLAALYDPKNCPGKWMKSRICSPRSGEMDVRVVKSYLKSESESDRLGCVSESGLRENESGISYSVDMKGSVCCILDGKLHV